MINRGDDSSVFSPIRLWADRTPDAEALAAPGYPPLTYARLASEIDRHAAALFDRRMCRGDRLAIVLPQGPEVITLSLAIAEGATAVPLNPGLNESDYAFWLSRVQPAAVILARGVDSPARTAASRLGVPILELSAIVGGAAGEFTLDGDRLEFRGSRAFSESAGVSLMLGTSGVTSRPKLVPLTARNMRAAAETTSVALGLTSSDRCLNVMPLFHGHGLVAGGLAQLIAGGSVVCTRGFDAAAFFRWLDEYRPTWYTAVPTMHRAILAEAPRHLQVVARCRLRFVRSASATLPLTLMADLERVFGTLVTESYGLTEAMQLTNTPLDRHTRKVGSLGVPGTSEIAIMNEGDDIAGPNEPGEIVCRGPAVISGYYDDDEANQRAFTNGWFRTGDLGSIDSDGHLFLTGRLKNIINRGGEKVSPEEVDKVLMQHPDLVEAAAFSVPHVSLGEDIAAAVVVRDGVTITEGEIRQFATRHLPGFKVPRRVLIVKEIAKGPTGKVQRARLAEILLEAHRSADFIAPRSPLEHQVAAIWEKLFGVSPIGANDDFFDLGGDSLIAAALMAAIEETCGRSFPPGLVLEASTVSRLSAAILREENGFDEPLTALRTSGRLAPLFFVHNDYGRGLYTHRLARCLDDDRPVYAVHLHGLVQHALPRTVEAIAAYRVEALRAVRPHGPYVIGGHCNGGAVALEMAHQLLAAGERVEMVALIDTAAPTLGRRMLRRGVEMFGRLRRMPPLDRAELYLRVARALEEVASRARHYQHGVRGLARSGPAAQMEFIRRQLVRVATHVSLVTSRVTVQDSTQRFSVSRPAEEDPHGAYNRAVRYYVPRSYAEPVVLFLAEEERVTRPDLGWSRRLLPRLDVLVTPGDHHTCITRHVAAFADRFETVLQRIRSDG